MTSKALRLSLPEGDLPFTIVHRPRVTRRLHLELDAKGGLQVVVPRDWPDFYTHRLLRKNLAYVQRFLDRARSERPEPLCWDDGGMHLYQGEVLTLRLLRPGTGSRAPRSAQVTRNEGHLDITLREPGAPAVMRALQGWYRREAERVFSQRLSVLRERAPWARNRDLTLRLRRMKRTWGTCNQQGVIRLNTHLIKAPPDCLDYVICHELCHLQEMNHGPDFYALQAQLWPNWRETRASLRRDGARYIQE